MARRLCVADRHLDALELLDDELSASLERRLWPNVNGAVAAIGLDLGFPWSSMRGLVITARMGGLTAHVVEAREQGTRWRGASPGSVAYTGPPHRRFIRGVDPTLTLPKEGS
jgi:citrate synthase